MSGRLRCSMLPSPYGSGLGLRCSTFRGHLCVRLRCGPVTRSHPYDDSVDGLQVIGFPPPCHPSYKASGFCLGGSIPAERASLFAGRTSVRRVFPDTAPRLAFQIGPSRNPGRSSLLPAYPSRNPGLPPSFVLATRSDSAAVLRRRPPASPSTTMRATAAALPQGPLRSGYAMKVLTTRIQAWENLKTSVASSRTGQPERWKVGR